MERTTRVALSGATPSNSENQTSGVQLLHLKTISLAMSMMQVYGNILSQQIYTTIAIRTFSGDYEHYGIYVSVDVNKKGYIKNQVRSYVFIEIWTAIFDLGHMYN